MIFDLPVDFSTKEGCEYGRTEANDLRIIKEVGRSMNPCALVHSKIRKMNFVTIMYFLLGPPEHFNF